MPMTKTFLISITPRGMVVAIGRFKLSRLTYSMSSEDASKWAAAAEVSHDRNRALPHRDDRQVRQPRATTSGKVKRRSPPPAVAASREQLSVRSGRSETARRSDDLPR